MMMCIEVSKVEQTSNKLITRNKAISISKCEIQLCNKYPFHITGVIKQQTCNLGGVCKFILQSLHEIFLLTIEIIQTYGLIPSLEMSQPCPAHFLRRGACPKIPGTYSGGWPYFVHFLLSHMSAPHVTKNCKL